ncbi:MAG: ABC transporter ATP-binding protein [Proteobacteria bacterium]|nr:ABC transporter ATP-binding protein [Pseudomonadota bacterium]
MKIETIDLSQSFPLSKAKSFPVFSGLDFVIESGSFTVLLGESGCGKSTLLSLLAGLIPITSGEVRADGITVTGPSPERTILFQQPSLLPWLTVKENISFGCRLRGDRDNLDARVNDLIRLIGLVGFENRHPTELSVGMAQRVCLARALIGQPQLLLLDEPFGFLDICNRARLQNELIGVWRERRFTIILVTHDVDEALIVGEKVIVLGGRPAEVLSVHEIDLPYPRDISSHSFFTLRATIINQLRAATTVGPQFPIHEACDVRK